VEDPSTKRIRPVQAPTSLNEILPLPKNHPQPQSQQTVLKVNPAPNKKFSKDEKEKDTKDSTANKPNTQPQSVVSSPQISAPLPSASPEYQSDSSPPTSKSAPTGSNVESVRLQSGPAPGPQFPGPQFPPQPIAQFPSQYPGLPLGPLPQSPVPSYPPQPQIPYSSQLQSQIRYTQGPPYNNYPQSPPQPQPQSQTQPRFTQGQAGNQALGPWEPSKKNSSMLISGLPTPNSQWQRDLADIEDCEVIDINGADLHRNSWTETRKEEAERLLALSRGVKPTRISKRKGQITHLAFESEQQELLEQERRHAARLLRQQTRAKYGW